MRIRSLSTIWTVTLAVSIVIPQSAIQSAIRNPQSAIQSAIRNPQSAIQSAIRNPQSAMSSSTSWRPLFDGRSLSAWRGYKSEGVPEGWKIADKTLAKDGHVGDLITKDEFGDFELELEW